MCSSDLTRCALPIYGPQLKIDEITNLGAVNIRLRSLFAALEERDEAAEEKAAPKAEA